MLECQACWSSFVVFKFLALWIAFQKDERFGRYKGNNQELWCVEDVLRLHLPIWTQEKILVEPPGLGLLPSGSELFPWRILMPHLHLGIVKGNRSLTLQSNKPILLRKAFFFRWSASHPSISWSLSRFSKEKMYWIWSFLEFLVVLRSHLSRMSFGCFLVQTSIHLQLTHHS